MGRWLLGPWLLLLIVWSTATLSFFALWDPALPGWHVVVPWSNNTEGGQFMTLMLLWFLVVHQLAGLVCFAAWVLLVPELILELIERKNHAVRR